MHKLTIIADSENHMLHTGNSEQSYHFRPGD